MTKYLTALFLLLSTGAFATTHWAQGELSDWFKNLHSPTGLACCGEEDGIQDPPYMENDDHTYEVYYKDNWHHVEVDKVVTATSRLAYPIVWPGYGDTVRCFLPGARS